MTNQSDYTLNNGFYNITIKPSAKNLIKSLNTLMKTIEDSESSLFEKYMAMNDLSYILIGAKSNRNNCRDAFRMGFDMSNPIFDSEDKEDGGWTLSNENTIDRNELIVHRDAQKESGSTDDMLGALKDLLEKL